MNWKNNKLFLFLTSVYWVLFCIMFSRASFMAGVIFSLGISFVYIFLPLEKEWLFVLSALPFMAMFKVSPSLPSTSVFLYMIFIFKGYTEGYRFKKQYFIRLLLLFGIQFFLLLFLGRSFVPLISLLVNLLFMTVATEIIISRSETGTKTFLTITSVYSVSVALMSLMSRIFPNIASLVSNVDHSFMLNGALKSRYSGIAGDPNYYTQLITIAIALSVSAFLVCHASRIHKIMLTFLSLYLVYCGVLTYSKSFYLTLSILALLVLWYIYRLGIATKKTFVILMAAAPVLIIGFYYFVIKFVLPGVLQRVTSTVDFSSGRFEIWSTYFEMLANNPFVIMLGAGIENARYLIAPYYGKVQAAHNAFIELFADTGIIGCFLLGGMYKKNILAGIRFVGNPISLFFLIFIVTSMSLSFSAYDTICFVIPLLPLLSLKNSGEAYNLNLEG